MSSKEVPVSRKPGTFRAAVEVVVHGTHHRAWADPEFTLVDVEAFLPRPLV